MKKIGICGGANIDMVLDTSLCYIGVDHGIDILIEQGIIPILGVGDFDSLQNTKILKSLEIECLPTRKDITDTHYALMYAIEMGYDDIALYGVTGGRIDHYMAVLCLLQKYHNTRITIYDAQNKIEILRSGEHRIYKGKYAYFSLFAISPTYVTLVSCEYPLDNYYLTKEDPLCVSNQTIGDFVDIKITEDIIFIQSSDKE